MGSGPRSEMFNNTGFPSDKVIAEFEKRRRLLEACVLKPENFRTVQNLVVDARWKVTIRLDEFAAWAVKIELEMPPELCALAESILTTQSKPPVSPTAAKPSKPFTHKIKNRAEAILTPEITQAKVKAPDPNSVASVWGELTKLAESGFGVMIGFSSDGIQYRGRKYQADQIPDVFTRRNLRERMTRKVVQKRAEPH